MAQFVEVTKQNGIATLLLKRGEAANALSLQMLHELNMALDEISYDSSIRVVILTGEGHKAFCAGADLKERQQMTEVEARQTVALIGETVMHIEVIDQPVIAAINGVAFGGGLELALACDIRCISETAVLGLTETSLGIIPGAGGTQRLPRLIGIGRAKELIYTARRITATEAREYGLVEHVVPAEELLLIAQALAEEMAKNAPLSLIQAKAAINSGVQVNLATGLQIEQLAYSRLLFSEDRLEGLQAFKEKRAPRYKGK